jgi:hypothetical protein
MAKCWTSVTLFDVCLRAVHRIVALTIETQSHFADEWTDVVKLKDGSISGR